MRSGVLKMPRNGGVNRSTPSRNSATSRSWVSPGRDMAFPWSHRGSPATRSELRKLPALGDQTARNPVSLTQVSTPRASSRSSSFTQIAAVAMASPRAVWRPVTRRPAAPPSPSANDRSARRSRRWKAGAHREPDCRTAPRLILLELQENACRRRHSRQRGHRRRRNS